jgi:L-rhamnose isomerase
MLRFSRKSLCESCENVDEFYVKLIHACVRQLWVPVGWKMSANKRLEKQRRRRRKEKQRKMFMRKRETSPKPRHVRCYRVSFMQILNESSE